MKNFFYFVRKFILFFWLTRGVLSTFILLLFLFSYGISRCEHIDYGNALYFCFITALTIGYGDIIPQTPLGKIISITVGFWGLIFVGLCVAIATLALKQTLIYHNIQRNRKKM